MSNIDRYFANRRQDCAKFWLGKAKQYLAKMKAQTDPQGKSMWRNLALVAMKGYHSNARHSIIR